MSLEELRKAGGVLVGTKQTTKALREGRVSKVYLAEDVDSYLADKIGAACDEAGVPAERTGTMAELGKAAGIEVGAAVVAILTKP